MRWICNLNQSIRINKNVTSALPLVNTPYFRFNLVERNRKEDDLSWAKVANDKDIGHCFSFSIKKFHSSFSERDRKSYD